MSKYLLNVGLALMALVTAGKAHALGNEVLTAPCGDDRDVHFTMVVPGNDVPEQFRPFSGIWKGQFDHFRLQGIQKTSSAYCTGLIVTTIRPNGSVIVVYFYGRNAELQIMNAAAFRHNGRIVGDTLSFQDQYHHWLHYKLGVNPKTGEPEMKVIQAMINTGTLAKLPYQPPVGTAAGGNPLPKAGH